MYEFIHFLITVAFVLLVLVVEHFAPQTFFWLLSLAARTPAGKLMTWRRCDALYYTENQDESAACKPDDLAMVQLHYEQAGMPAQSFAQGILTVSEEIVLVNFGRRFVGWSHRAPRRMRVFGFLHDGRFLYGAWFDWKEGSRFRGALFMDFDPRFTSAFGVWAGGPLKSQPYMRVRPWVWLNCKRVPAHYGQSKEVSGALQARSTGSPPESESAAQLPLPMRFL